MSGKGDTPRPMQVEAEVFSRNFDRIFGEKKRIPPKEVKTPPQELDEELWV